MEVKYTSELRFEHPEGRVSVLLSGKGISILSFDSNGVAAPIPPEVWDEVKDYITEMAYYAVCLKTVDIEARESSMGYVKVPIVPTIQEPVSTSIKEGEA